MNSLRSFILSALVLMLGLSLVSDASAQRGPRKGKRTDDTAVVRKSDKIRHHHKDGLRGHSNDILRYLDANQDCLRLLLSQMSEEDAAAFTRLAEALKNQKETHGAIKARMKAAREAGDTAAYRAAQLALREAMQEHARTHKAMNELLRKYHDAIHRLRESCGDRKDKDGSGGDVRDRAMIVPNPVAVGEDAVLKLTLSADASVAITVMGREGAVLEIPAAAFTAGAHEIALDVSGLERGAYVVQLTIGDKRHVVKLLIN